MGKLEFINFILKNKMDKIILHNGVRSNKNEEGKIIEIIKGEDVYNLGEFLGKGAFSNVYHGNLNERAYAIKIIPRNKRNDKIFEREVEIQASLSHRNILFLEGFFQDPENNYIILEYCNSKTLHETLKDGKITTLFQIKGYILQIIDGLQYIHSQMVVHCDIKPQNIYLHNFSEVKIADFGLSRKLSSPTEKIVGSSGTPNYIAPEKLLPSGFSFSADIWALIVTWYILIFESTPFLGKTPIEVYKKILNVQYVIPEEHRFTENEQRDYAIFLDIMRRSFVLDKEIRLSLEQIKSMILDEA